MVWRTARRLDAALASRVLIRTDLRWPSLATASLAGRTVIGCTSVGKHLLTRVEGGLTLHSHLRMDGSWHVRRTGDEGARWGSGVRAVLVNDDWTAIGYRLGMLDLVRTSAEADLVGHLGPDVLALSWDAQAVTARLGAQPERCIGEVLLDQQVLAGVGTFYMCEVLFLRGVTPWTPAGQTDLAAIVTLVHRLMTANRDRAVQVTTGDARRGHEQWVHARSGRPCHRCGATVRVAPIGQAPKQRTAFYCPSCQVGPTPTDDGGPRRPLGSGARRRPGAAATSRSGRRAGPRG